MIVKRWRGYRIEIRCNPWPHDRLGWIVAWAGAVAFAAGCAFGIYLRLKGYRP